LDVILQKFVSVNSSFYNPEYPRKLILRSSTILVKDYFREIKLKEEKDLFQESMDEYIEILNSFLLTNKKEKDLSTNEKIDIGNMDNLDQSKIITNYPKKFDKTDENSDIKSIRSINQKIRENKIPKKFDIKINENKTFINVENKNKPENSSTVNKNSNIQDDTSLNYNLSVSEISSEPSTKFVRDRKLACKIFGNNKNLNEKNIENNNIRQNEDNIIGTTKGTKNEEKVNDIIVNNESENNDFENNFFKKYEIFISENFMDLKKVCRKINVIFEILEDNKIEKKMKKLLSFIYPKEEKKNFVVCSKQKNINLLIKETLKKRNIDFTVFNSGKIFL